MSLYIVFSAYLSAYGFGLNMFFFSCQLLISTSPQMIGISQYAGRKNRFFTFEILKTTTAREPLYQYNTCLYKKKKNNNKYIIKYNKQLTRPQLYTQIPYIILRHALFFMDNTRLFRSSALRVLTCQITRTARRNNMMVIGFFRQLSPNNNEKNRFCDLIRVRNTFTRDIIMFRPRTTLILIASASIHIIIIQLYDEPLGEHTSLVLKTQR